MPRGGLAYLSVWPRQFGDGGDLAGGQSGEPSEHVAQVGVGSRLPLAALVLFVANHEGAEIGGEMAVSEVLGGAGGLATAGCIEDTDARGGVGEAEGQSAIPILQHRLRVEVWEVVRLGWGVYTQKR